MAIWNNILSDHDRQVLEARPSRPSRGLGEHPAVLVIDMNCGAVGTNRPNYEQVDEYPGTCGLFAWSAIPNMQEVIAAARNANIPVVYTKLIYKATHDWPRAKDPNYRFSELSPQSEILPEIAPQPGDLLIETQQHSGFCQTPLLPVLMNKKVDTLIVIGASTSGCVRATVVDATTYQCFKVAVVEDAVCDSLDISHQSALFDLQRMYCDVLPSKEIVEYIASVKAAKAEPVSV